MARMIPPVIDDQTPSPGERLVFERLRDDPDTEGWIVLHSVSLPRHLRQVEGEVDFVVVVPRLGVLCLEVKAHRSVRRDEQGMWFLGSQQPTPRSPFRQSSEAMHSLRKSLFEHAPSLRAVPFTSAVCFTHVNFNVERPEEWHTWQVIDAGDLMSQPISALVKGVLTNALRHYASHGLVWVAGEQSPSPELAEVAVRTLRPSFDMAETRKTSRARTAAELRRFTEEQFIALDALAAAPRVLFNGPAGTGKTFLAIEAARRAVMEGQRTLLCCYNRPLATWISQQIQHDLLTVSTFHSYMLSVAGSPEPVDSPSWWSRDLPELALESLLDSPDQLDCLIVDEAQDLLNDAYLNCMDISLRGGLSAGRWLFFSDLQRQSIYGTTDGSELLALRAPNHVPYSLLVNCRNTPSIAQYMAVLAGFSSGYNRVMRPDNGHIPRVLFYTTDEQQGDVLGTLFAELRKARVEPADVVILSRTRQSAAVAHLPQSDPWKSRMSTLSERRQGGLRQCTIFSFKGLEAPVVVVTGVDEATSEEAQSLLYVALSRPTERLYVIADERLRTTLARLVTERLFQEAEN